MDIILNSINKTEAFRYMGQKGNVDANLQKNAEICEKKLLDVINAKFIFKIYDISKSENKEVKVCGTSLVFKGNDIYAHLEGCDRAVLMCVSLGADTDRLIRITEITDISSAFIIDAMASAAVEEVCDIAQEYIKKQTDGFFTWRFSPGYGDFPIEIQKEFLEVMNAPKFIGLCTDENNILVPRKSVTAVMGISENQLPKKRLGCVSCIMSEKCIYRKRGEHCEF